MLTLIIGIPILPSHAQTQNTLEPEPYSSPAQSVEVSSEPDPISEHLSEPEPISEQHMSESDAMSVDSDAMSVDSDPMSVDSDPLSLDHDTQASSPRPSNSLREGPKTRRGTGKGKPMKKN